ncbi:helix-turn-helix domain-containing protein [Nocardiopsis eucommiae]|uniref:AraC family transcriptional regulator n=1 Tax=Nocardiopsis eucommiae TaxID=2831970 RepID=UPI003D745F63
MDGRGRDRTWDFTVAAPDRAPGVAAMVGYRNRDEPATIHLGLPSASLTLILGLDGGVEAADAPDRLADACPNPVLLGGLHTHATHVLQRPGQTGIQVAVHPLASRALFGVPGSELAMAASNGFDGTALLGRSATELHERLAGAPDWETAFTLVSRYLVGCHREHDRQAVRGEVGRAWELLARSRGRFPVGELAREVGLSARHLGTLFRREVGRSPKTVATLMRFGHARALITENVRRRGRARFAEVAPEAGYGDQAHLNREFVRFTGLSPGAWVAEEFRNIQDGAHTAAKNGHHE